MPATALQLLRARALKVLRQPLPPMQTSDLDEQQRYFQLTELYLQRLLTEGANDDEAAQRMARTLAYLQGVVWLETTTPTPVTLHQWQILYTEKGLQIRAQRYGHPERPDGSVVTTSRLVGLGTQQIQTRNSLYTLGTPLEGQQEQLALLGDLLYQLHFIHS